MVQEEHRFRTQDCRQEGEMDEGAMVKRSFRLWHYRASHRQLVIRSLHTESYPTQVDILFKNVQAVHLPTEMIGFIVRKAGADEALTIQDSAGVGHFADEHVFVVDGDGYRGFVIASAMNSTEYDGEFSDLSPLLIR